MTHCVGLPRVVRLHDALELPPLLRLDDRADLRVRLLERLGQRARPLTTSSTRRKASAGSNEAQERVQQREAGQERAGPMGQEGAEAGDEGKRRGEKRQDRGRALHGLRPRPADRASSVLRQSRSVRPHSNVTLLLSSRRTFPSPLSLCSTDRCCRRRQPARPDRQRSPPYRNRGHLQRLHSRGTTEMDFEKLFANEYGTRGKEL